MIAEEDLTNALQQDGEVDGGSIQPDNLTISLLLLTQVQECFLELLAKDHRGHFPQKIWRHARKLEATIEGYLEQFEEGSNQ